MHAGKIAIDIYLCFHTDLNANQCWTPTLDFIYESVKEVSINLLNKCVPRWPFTWMMCEMYTTVQKCDQ